jgi:uncharacterized protein
VNNSNNPLRLNVGYLYNKPIGTSREVTVDFGEIEIEDLQVQDLESTVRLSRTREGLLMQVSAEARVETTCVRCLDTFFLKVAVSFEELYQFPSRHREETDLILPADGYIDLDPLYREYLILAMPIKRLCQEDRKGLCAICGVNLNGNSCEHHPNPSETNEATHQETA